MSTLSGVVVSDMDTATTEDVAPANVSDTIHVVLSISVNVNVIISLVRCLFVTGFHN